MEYLNMLMEVLEKKLKEVKSGTEPVGEQGCTPVSLFNPKQNIL